MAVCLAIAIHFHTVAFAPAHCAPKSAVIRARHYVVSPHKISSFSCRPSRKINKGASGKVMIHYYWPWCRLTLAGEEAWAKEILFFSSQPGFALVRAKQVSSRKTSFAKQTGREWRAHWGEDASIFPKRILIAFQHLRFLSPGPGWNDFPPGFAGGPSSETYWCTNVAVSQLVRGSELEKVWVCKGTIILLWHIFSPLSLPYSSRAASQLLSVCPPIRTLFFALPWFLVGCLCCFSYQELGSSSSSRDLIVSSFSPTPFTHNRVHISHHN